jgi:DNA-directed RNA polymerase subunit RPC12/RpoP
MESNNNEFRDVVFTCKDCGQQFIWERGEQEFFNSKSLSPPLRCRPCRRRRKDTLVPYKEEGRQ